MKKNVLHEGFHKVIMQSDGLSLIQKVNAPDRDRSSTGPNVADIKYLANNFVSFSYIYVTCSANEVSPTG